MEFKYKPESPMVDGVPCNKLTREGQHQESNFDVALCSIRSQSEVSKNNRPMLVCSGAPGSVTWGRVNVSTFVPGPAMSSGGRKWGGQL